MLFANNAETASGYTHRNLTTAFHVAIIVLIALCGMGAARADVTGEALVIDGDTLQVAAERVRLHGIDAPETNQVCGTGPVDLNAAMVRSGWALAYRRYAKDYVPQEIEARAESRGLWRGSFDAPWSWRKGERTAAVRD